uniref:Uncharacterized protein n=1 Tax=Globisporangium ultimum (strain ATCC 200006 / CBS 805.95 / DAOM BR144) TaxID=431595 RepID=K3WWH0_GLOUD
MSVLKNKQVQPPVGRTSSAKRQLLLFVASVVGVVSLSLAMVGMHADTFQHETHRLLQEIQQAKGIHLVLTPKDNTTFESGVLIHGYFFPTTDLNTSSTIDGSTFDGRISMTIGDIQLNYTLLDGRAYMSEEDQATGKVIRRNCLSPSSLPPIHQFTDSLANARVIDDVASSSVKCDGGKLIEFMFAGEPFVYCYKPEPSSSNFDTIHSESLEASVQFLSNISDGFLSRNALQPPSDFDLAKCGKVDVTATTSSTRSLAQTLKTQAAAVVAATARRAQDVVTVATGNRRLGLFGSSDCSCTGGKKVCLFVHGLGREGTIGLFDDDTNYWGSIKSKANCCSVIKFLRMDTENTPWYADTLPKQVCDAAVSLTGSTNRMALNNIALIGHSMGNLVIAAAAFKNMCAIGPSSKWIAMSGPMGGSMSSNTAIGTCDDTSVLKKPAVEVFKLVGFCPAKASTQSLAYQGSKHASNELNSLYIKAQGIFQKYVTSNLCGINPTGIVSTSSVRFTLLATVSLHPTDQNDGAVDFTSCRGGFPASKYGKKYTDKFYRPDLNHADSAFRNGDGLLGDERKPVKWFNCQF